MPDQPQQIQHQKQVQPLRRKYSKRAPLSPWVWTPARLQAVQMHWEGRLTGAERAAVLGVSRRTLAYWAAQPEFQQRRKEIMEAVRAESDRRWREKCEADLKDALARMYGNLGKRSHKKK